MQMSVIKVMTPGSFAASNNRRNFCADSSMRAGPRGKLGMTICYGDRGNRIPSQISSPTHQWIRRNHGSGHGQGLSIFDLYQVTKYLPTAEGGTTRPHPLLGPYSLLLEVALNWLARGLNSLRKRIPSRQKCWQWSQLSNIGLPCGYLCRKM